jgi:hypothetical protein
MTAAIVESSGAHQTLRIEIEPDAGFDSEWSVTLDAGYLKARHGFFSGEDPTILIAFFEDLSSAWKGWKGSKSVEIGHEFRLDATHDGRSEVSIAVTLGTAWFEQQTRLDRIPGRRREARAGFLARASIAFDAEAIDRATQEIRKLQ